jgi:ABC-type polysaccharide transport system permease subunit
LILRIGDLLGANFEKVLLLQNDLNLSVSELLPPTSTRWYGAGKYSFSAAVGLFNAVVSLMLVLVANYASKKLSSDTKAIFLEREESVQYGKVKSRGERAFDAAVLAVLCCFPS